MESKNDQLIQAAFAGRDKDVKALLSAGADVNAEDMSGFTPLLLAAEKGHTETIKILVSAGADLAAKDFTGSTPLDYIERLGGREELQQWLRENADPSVLMTWHLAKTTGQPLTASVCAINHHNDQKGNDDMNQQNEPTIEQKVDAEVAGWERDYRSKNPHASERAVIDHLAKQASLLTIVTLTGDVTMTDVEHAIGYARASMGCSARLEKLNSKPLPAPTGDSIRAMISEQSEAVKKVLPGLTASAGPRG